MRRSTSILRNHHIIPQNLRCDPPFNGIDRQGLGVDAPRNQIYLPADYELAGNMGLSPHPGGHDSLYYEAICRTLDRLAKTADPGIRAAQIEALSDAMRAGFVNGDLYTNVPIGKTREEVDRAIRSVVDDYATYRENNLDRVQAIRALEQRGTEAGYSHLGSWAAILGNASREKLLSEAIRNNPGLNITSGNRNLGGTPWQQKFMAADDDFHLPGSEPFDPNHVPPLPGFIPSPLPEFAPEGFTRSDPRLADGLSGFPAASPDWRRIGQLPPSTAAPSMPQILQFHPETGQQRFMSDGSPMLGPNPYEMPRNPDDPSPLIGLGIFAGAMAAPALIPTLPAWAWALGALSVTGATAGSSANAEPSNNSGGGVFATGAPPYNSFGPGGASNANSQGGQPIRTQSSAPSLSNNALDRETVLPSTFSDRFGNCSGIAAVPTPPQRSSRPAPPAVWSPEATMPEQLRRLTRANASNAGSVFESGSAPVSYLPSEFSDRFGNWRSAAGGMRQQQARSSLGAFPDEPGYDIPPPIWGSKASANPRSDAEEWFARWVQPILRQD